MRKETHEELASDFVPNELTEFENEQKDLLGDLLEDLMLEQQEGA